MFKNIKMFIIGLFTFILFLPSVLAASGNISVSSTNQVVVGNKVTVTVTISSQTSIGSWQMNLNYDKSFLQLTSATSEAGGTMMAASSATGVKSKSYTFTFKTLKTGNTSLSVSSALAYAFDDLSQISLSTGSKSIKIITQQELEASYSKDNNLKSLKVDGYELTPAFSADTLEYNVIVPENTKEINISAQVSDGKSTISGTGTKEVSGGTNTFNIIVRAQNGSEKTYIVTVDVKDNNPIEVYIEGKGYTVVKVREYLPKALSYEETTVNINEFEIPAYKSDLTGFTLVGLKDSSGEISLFIYDNGNYTKYSELVNDTLTIYLKDTDKELKGYKKIDVTLKDIKTKGFVRDEDSNFVIIYGINVDNGEEGFYTYDKKNNSLISFDDSIISLMETYENKINLYSYIIIGFSVILVIMFILLIKKAKKKQRKADISNIKNKISKDELDDLIASVDKKLAIEEKEDNIIKNNVKKNKKFKKR